MGKIFNENRMLILLISFIVYWIVTPFLEGSFLVKILTDVFFTAILIAAIHAAGKNLVQTLIALALAVPVFYGTWEKYVEPLPDTIIFGPIFSGLFTFYVILLLLQAIFRSPEVDAEAVSAAACVYLFLGLLWGDFYFILEHLAPGSFNVPDTADTTSYHAFNYFSYVTLSTLGYGEITPVTKAARSLTSMEALVGQLYIAVLIARLVGIYSGRASKPAASPEDRD